MGTSFRKPRPRPPKALPARDTLPEEVRKQIAHSAEYVGSAHHTDIPKFGLQASPRPGATTIESAEEQGLKNPSCVVCSRKWARRQQDAQHLLRAAIEVGNFIAVPGNEMPRKVWARDPDDAALVYEARLLSHPPRAYKGYPLTRYQAEYNLPITVA
jgi:hypothetical protein